MIINKNIIVLLTKNKKKLRKWKYFGKIKYKNKIYFLCFEDNYYDKFKMMKNMMKIY